MLQKYLPFKYLNQLPVAKKTVSLGASQQMFRPFLFWRGFRTSKLHLAFIENRLQKLLLLICFFGRLTFMVAIGNNNESSNWSRPYCNETLSNFKESKKKDNAYCTACSKQGFWPNNDRVSFKSLRSINQLIKCMYFCWREQYYTQIQGVHISILPKSLKVGFFSEKNPPLIWNHISGQHFKNSYR